MACPQSAHTPSVKFRGHTGETPSSSLAERGGGVHLIDMDYCLCAGHAGGHPLLNLIQLINR